MNKSVSFFFLFVSFYVVFLTQDSTVVGDFLTKAPKDVLLFKLLLKNMVFVSDFRIVGNSWIVSIVGNNIVVGYRENIKKIRKTGSTTVFKLSHTTQLHNSL